MMGTGVWTMRFIRDATGHVHKLIGHDARLVVACRAQLEEPIVRLPEVPEAASDEALCSECWPRWPSDWGPQT